jgi:DNA topoisomerase I
VTAAPAAGAATPSRRPASPPTALDDAAAAASEAGLRYVSDEMPGIRRRRRGRGFSYLAPGGGAVRDPDTLARIRSLAIPPAWTEVWICPSPRGHVQATGRDARGRKQYRYHPRWREVRDATKFDRMRDFAAALPGLRRRVESDLKRRGMPREKVLATLVRLLETTCIRVGNDEYRRANGTVGLTTLRNGHVQVRGARLFFRFRAKGGKTTRVTLTDRSVAKIVRACQDIPGYELFQYYEGREPRSIDSADVNAYLREVTGAGFTAKDFRTWMGTVHAVVRMREGIDGAPARPTNSELLAVIDHVAEQLSNTRAVCRKFYVHPGLQQAYLDGVLGDRIAKLALRPLAGLSADEALLVALLGDLDPSCARGGRANQPA